MSSTTITITDPALLDLTAKVQVPRFATPINPASEPAGSAAQPRGSAAMARFAVTVGEPIGAPNAAEPTR